MRFSMSPSMKWHNAPPLSSSLILAYQFLTFCLVSISALEVLTIAIHLPLFSFGNRYLHSWRMREGSRDTKRHERKQCACCLDIYTTHLVVFFISSRSNHWLHHDCFSFVLFYFESKISAEHVYVEGERQSVAVLRMYTVPFRPRNRYSFSPPTLLVLWVTRRKIRMLPRAHSRQTNRNIISCTRQPDP